MKEDILLLPEEDIIIWPEKKHPLTLGQKLQRITIEMDHAIQEMTSNGEKEGFIKWTPGIGKTTFYCNIIKKTDKPVMILLPTNGVYEQIQEWIGDSKKSIIIDTNKLEALTDIINRIDKNTVLITNFRTFNSIHKKHPILFNALITQLGYVFSDELHRGIWPQTILAMKDIIQQDVLWSNTLEYEDETESDETYLDEIYPDEKDADISLESAMKNNKQLIHIWFTGTPTYSHKSVYNSFTCIYNYTTQRWLEEGIITPLKQINVGEGVQYVAHPQRKERDLEMGYKEYFIERNGELVPIADAVLDEIIALKTKESIYAMGVCVTIEQIKEIEKKCKKKWLRPYVVHGGNKKYKAEGNLQTGKKRIETDKTDIMLVCNTGVEALDIPILNTLWYFYAIHSPVKLNQSIGRVTRALKGKKYANIIIPLTKIVYAPKAKNKIWTGGKIPSISNTVGRLDWKDVYYTLGDFSEEYLQKHGIYTKEYLKFLKKQYIKRQEIEGMKTKLLETLEIRLETLWLPEAKVLYKLFDDIGVINNSTTVLHECMEIISYSKKFLLSESGRNLAITSDDFSRYLKTLDTEHIQYPNIDIATHKFFTQAELDILFERKQKIAKTHTSTLLRDTIQKHNMTLFDEQQHREVRDTLVANSLPLTLIIADIFNRDINWDTVSWITLDDIIQECIAENIIITDIYDPSTYTKYYEVICWNTIKTITTMLIEHNNKIPIKKSIKMGIFNEFTRLLLILNKTYNSTEENKDKIYSHEEINNTSIKSLNEIYNDRKKGIKEEMNTRQELDLQLKKEIFSLLMDDRYIVQDIESISDDKEYKKVEDMFAKKDFKITLDLIGKHFVRSERNIKIIEDIFGINASNIPLTSNNIGEKFDMTTGNVNGIKERIIRKIKNSDYVKGHLKQFLCDTME